MHTLNIVFGLVLSAMMTALNIQGQARFISSGKVEYEKKVNMHKLIEDNNWTREIKERFPPYSVSYFDLVFTTNQSVYKKGKDAGEDKWKNFWGQSGTDDNVTKNDFDLGKTLALKQVFEKKFLVDDSLLNIEWRITDETREIAGFECRKAVGRMFDSLYVVAFYTDQILVPSGPEVYQGLPGLILGLAFPRYYTTWFATKVELTEAPAAAFAINPGKAQKITRVELFKQVKDVFRWGSEEDKQRSFWQTVL